MFNQRQKEALGGKSLVKVQQVQEEFAHIRMAFKSILSVSMFSTGEYNLKYLSYLIYNMSGNSEYSSVVNSLQMFSPGHSPTPTDIQFTVI